MTTRESKQASKDERLERLRLGLAVIGILPQCTKDVDGSGSEAGAPNLVVIVPLDHRQTLVAWDLRSLGEVVPLGVASSAMLLAMLAPWFPTS